MYCVVNGCRTPAYATRAEAQVRAREVLQQHPTAWWVSRVRVCKRCSSVIGSPVFHLFGEDELVSASNDSSDAESVCESAITPGARIDADAPAVVATRASLGVSQDAVHKDAASLLTERLLATWDRMKSQPPSTAADPRAATGFRAAADANTRADTVTHTTVPSLSDRLIADFRLRQQSQR